MCTLECLIATDKWQQKYGGLRVKIGTQLLLILQSRSRAQNFNKIFENKDWN